MPLRKTFTFNNPAAFVIVCLALITLYVVNMASVLISPARADCDEFNQEQLPEVVILGTDWCQFCKKSRWFLEDHDVDYCEYNIEKSAVGAQKFQQLGGNQIPIILVGSQRVDGFTDATKGKLLAMLRQQNILQ